MTKSCAETDLQLAEAAHQLLVARYHKDRHEIGAALRTRSGRLFAAVNVDTQLGRMAVCAEAVAIGMAAAAGDTEIEVIVAVNKRWAGGLALRCLPGEIADYASDCRVIIPGQAGPEVTLITELFPHRYRKDGRPR